MTVGTSELSTRTPPATSRPDRELSDVGAAIAAQPSRSTGGRKLRRALLVLAGVSLLFAIPAGVPDSVDAGARLLQARALVTQGSLAIPAEMAGNSLDGLHRNGEGKWYSKYGIGLPIVWLLPVAAATGAARLTGLPAATLSGFAITFVNPLVMVATVLSLLTILRRLAASPMAQAISVASFVLGTMTLPYVNSCWSEPLAGLLTLWAIACPLLQPSSWKSAVVSGLLVAAATLVKSEMVLLGAPLLWLYRTNWRRAALFSLSAGLGPLMVLLLNAGMTGSLFRTPYSGEASLFHEPFTGLHGFLVGSERNLFVFMPGLVIGLVAWLFVPASNPLRPGRITVIAASVMYLLLYAAWHSWWGGLCFGPRYLYPLAAIAVLPIGPVLCGQMSQFGLRSWLARGVAAALAMILLLEVPLQVAGMSVKDHQAVAVSEITRDPQWLSQMKLLRLKASRGWSSPEVYRKSDFVRLAAGEADTEINHRSFYTYQSFNHWWSLLLANRLRQNRSPIKSI